MEQPAQAGWRETEFSPCRTYRYVLWRSWDMFNTTTVMVCGLNPSTADETNDDPTIRRCIDYAKRWGYGALCMTNLFAYRATDPRWMASSPDPVGPDNDRWLVTIAHDVDLVLVAWGAHPLARQRGLDVCALLGTLPLVCLGTTRGGAPRHPLYVPKTRRPQPYSRVLP